MEIIINETWKCLRDDHFNHIPMQFIKGTGETFKVAGKDCVSKDKWITHQRYYKDLAGVVDFISQYETLEYENIKLKDYLNVRENKVQMMLDSLSKSTSRGFKG